MSNITKKALADSLLRLLQKRSIDDITVKEIADGAGVNRQTFYYHFHDIYALIEWMVEQGLQGLMKTDNWQEDLKNTFDFLQQNRQLVLNLCRSIKQEVIVNWLQQVIRPGIHFYLHNINQSQKRPDEDIDFLERLLTLACCGLLLDWLHGNMKEEPGPLLEKLERLILRNL